MRWLVDAAMPRPTAEILRGFGHDVEDVRDVGLADADDSIIAHQAIERQRCLLTRDLDFADPIRYPPEQFQGIVVVRLPESVTRQFVLSVVARFAAENEILALLPGRLCILEVDRIRLRPGT